MATIKIKGYTREDGTEVKGHKKSVFKPRTKDEARAYANLRIMQLTKRRGKNHQK